MEIVPPTLPEKLQKKLTGGFSNSDGNFDIGMQSFADYAEPLMKK